MSIRLTPCTAKKTFETALASGNDLLTQVKGNQGALLALLKACAETGSPQDTDQSSDASRNRQEHRDIQVFDVAEALASTDWAGLITTLILVQRRTLCRNSATRLWSQSKESAYYVASCTASAKAFGQIIRDHWGIENRNHHVRDVTLREDASRIRANPAIMARLKSTALNILRANGETNIAEALWQNVLNPLKLFKYRGVSQEK